MGTDNRKQYSMALAIVGVFSFILIFYWGSMYFKLFIESTGYIIKNYPTIRKILLVLSIPYFFVFMIVSGLATADVYSSFSEKDLNIKGKDKKYIRYTMYVVMSVFVVYNIFCVYIYLNYLRP